MVGGVLLGLERTLDEDVAYGLRMLVDMAERALADSPFLDPTTAVQAIDRIHDCLRQLSCREFPDGRHRDADGVVRLVVPVMDWDAYVHLGFDEIRLAGAGSPQVTRRLSEALTDLETVARPDRLAVLRRQRELLEDSVGEAMAEKHDINFALESDRQGIGVEAGVSGDGRPRPSRRLERTTDGNFRVRLVWSALVGGAQLAADGVGRVIASLAS